MVDDIDKLPFYQFCRLCDLALEKHGRDYKSFVIQRFITYVRNKHQTAEAVYSVMRLLLPDIDRERGAYGIKEINFATLYIKLLDLPKNSQDAVRLREYKAKPSSAGGINDFAEIAYGIIKKRDHPSAKLTIKDINEALDKIAKAHADSKPGERFDVLLDTLINKLSAQEQKWIIRIILKSMHLGIGSTQILKLYHPDAVEYINSVNNLWKVCEKLISPDVRLSEMNVHLFDPFKPMRSARCDLQNLKFEGEYFVETKFDGDRFQLHYDKGEFRFFTRNGYTVSAYGSNELTGYFTNLLAKQFQPGFESFILDGEMMAWHKTQRRLITQGNFRDVKHLKAGSIAQPCFFPFDILFCNGEVLTKKPLEERLSVLEKLYKPEIGVIMKVDRIRVSSNEEILKALNAAIDRREEGIIVKGVTSIYKPNEKFDGGWFKIKPEYTEGALTELDLMIIGGYFGEGKFQGMVSQFLVGLAVPSESGEPKQFQSLCSVGSGLGFAELDELREKLYPHWIKFKKDKPQQWHLFGRAYPDVFIEPKNSCILQIKASQIVASSKFFCGFSLRFPRVERTRFDKPWTDCLTTEEFHQLRRRNAGMLTTGHIVLGKNSKKRKLPPSETAPEFKKPSLDKIISKTSIFRAKEICVVTGCQECKKEMLEEFVIENGGKIVSTPTSSTYCLVVGDLNLRVQNYISAKKHVIVKHTWVLDTVATGEMLPWSTCYVLSMSKACKKEISEQFDKYGDHYFQPATRRSIEFVLQNMKVKHPKAEELLQKLSQHLFKGLNPHSCMANFTAYFLEKSLLAWKASVHFHQLPYFFCSEIKLVEKGKNKIKSKLLLQFVYDAAVDFIKGKVKATMKNNVYDVQCYYQSLVGDLCFEKEKFMFRFLSGKLSSDVDHSTNFLVCHDSYELDSKKVLELKSKGHSNIAVVTQDWVHDCWESKNKLDIDDYAVSLDDEVSKME